MTSPITIPRTPLPLVVRVNHQEEDDPPGSAPLEIAENRSIELFSSSFPPYHRSSRVYSGKSFSTGRSRPISLSSSCPNDVASVRARYPFRILRKCAYAIAVVAPQLFVASGAKCIGNDVYILSRKYDGSSTGETSAIIGIGKKFINDLLDGNRDSPLYTILRSCPILSDIPGIADLSPYKLTALRCMQKYLYFVYDKELILFNIEPKGTAANERLYPCANICLPGGGMEPKDEYCYEETMRREFREEIGLQLPDSGTPDFKIITKQKFTFPDRQAMYFWIRIRAFKTPEHAKDENLDI